MSKPTKECIRCNVSFGRHPSFSHTQWEDQRYCSRKCAATKRAQSDEEIISLYQSGRSATDIAASIGLSQVQVSRIVRAHGVARSASEYQKLSHSRPEVRAKLSVANTGRKCREHVKVILRQRFGPKHQSWRSGLTKQVGGYLAFTDSRANGAHAGRYLHQIVAEWKLKRPLKPDEVVHHIDHNKLNNDPDNLAVMTPQEHARVHAEDRKKKC